MVFILCPAISSSSVPSISWMLIAWIQNVLYTIICLANSQKIDLDKAIRKSMDKVTKRDKKRYSSQN